MKKRCYPKRVNPKLMLTHFSEMFKSVGLKKPAFRNLLLTILGVCVAKTFRINEIASRLPIVVATEKSKQKRLLRFLETSLPLGDIQRAYFACVVGRLWPDETSRKLFLVDETDLIRGWKVIVAAIAFRHRAIPVLWLLYKDKEIQHGKYKSHNEIVQRFCLKLYELAVSSAPQAGRLEPILVLTGGLLAPNMSSSFSRTERFRLSCGSVAPSGFDTKEVRRNLMILKISFTQACFITRGIRFLLNSTSAEIIPKTRCI